MKTKFILSILFIAGAFNCFAQNTLTGRLISKDDKKPIAAAVVFLNKTGISAVSTDSGTFALQNIPNGQYQLIVTIIGYKDIRMPVNIQYSRRLADLELITRIHALDTVVIKGKHKLSPFFYVFEKAFLGPTLFARQCKILNPDVIQFYDTDQQGNYSARSNGFVEVENDALGYKIKILLNNFKHDVKTLRTDYTGQSYFEEMQGTPDQQHEWQKNRLECYQGSVMQLLRSVLADNVKENGFRIKRVHREDNPYFNRNGLETDPYDIDNSVDIFGNSDNVRYDDKISGGFLSGKDILLKTNVNGLFAMTSDNGFYVVHTGNNVITADNKVIKARWMWHSTYTFITFNKPYAIFDHNGIIANPGSITYQGFFTESSWIATILPFDYQPM